jgi:hypothetical protein
VVADVDIDIPNVTGNFGVHFHVLERLELSRDSQGIAKRSSFNAHHGSFRDIGAAFRMSGIISFTGSSAHPSPGKENHDG